MMQKGNCVCILIVTKNASLATSRSYIYLMSKKKESHHLPMVSASSD
uniref:Uncharacterized protein n=1 Tax=Rhizophora mucronata TaxID=61149 RepID=A0A2P2MYD4_RHIMU